MTHTDSNILNSFAPVLVCFTPQNGLILVMLYGLVVAVEQWCWC